MEILKQTFEYKKVQACGICADVYRAENSCAPVVVYIHGGGLIFGSRKDIVKKQVERYHQAGFTVVSIDYRLAPETKLRSILEDVEDALRWVKEEGPKLFDIDSERIAVVGSSAGGYLALMAGTFCKKPKAIVSFYGYGDILGDWYTKPSAFHCQKMRLTRQQACSCVDCHPVSEGSMERYLYYLYCRQQGIWPTEVCGLLSIWDQEAYFPFRPVKNIQCDYPPTLLLHGDQDTDVPYGQSVEMIEELHRCGIESRLIRIPGADHLFDQDMDNPVVKEAFEEVIAFLQDCLK